MLIINSAFKIQFFPKLYLTVWIDTIEKENFKVQTLKNLNSITQT